MLNQKKKGKYLNIKNVLYIIKGKLIEWHTAKIDKSVPAIRATIRNILEFI
jgi:hypothetical protein